MQVRAKTHTGGRESRQQAIVKVMVDLLLDMEGISLSQGLVYVLDGLKSYPVSGIKGWVKFSKPFGPDVEEASEDGLDPSPVQISGRTNGLPSCKSYVPNLVL